MRTLKVIKIGIRIVEVCSFMCEIVLFAMHCQQLFALEQILQNFENYKYAKAIYTFF